MFEHKEAFKKAYEDKFNDRVGGSLQGGTSWEQYETLVHLLADQLKESWADTNKEYSKYKKKQIYYFSMEFLIGKLLSCYLTNLGIKETVAEGLRDLGLKLEDLLDQESDAGLGNGGLGRLAACFLDSMAFLGVPGHGNGIRYQYGLFKQKIVDGYQVEVPDAWMQKGYPWEVRRDDRSVIVRFRGNVRQENRNGRLTFIHENCEEVLAVPYDIPIVSYGNTEQINTLRLWSAEPVYKDEQYCPVSDWDCNGRLEDYEKGIEGISNILYPDDHSQAGRELRLKQEYFFVSSGLASIVRNYKKNNSTIVGFSRKVSIHINDTHPALCVPELMRILLDEEGLSWEDAWEITINTISYTNHTILPEALEKWPVEMMAEILPRIHMIIEEIDRRFKDRISTRYVRVRELISNTSVIFDGQVWMANLAVIGSHSVNGVSALHTEILKHDVHPDFNVIYPYKYNNKTNGISHRRFVLDANPALSGLISESIGDGWISDASQLEKLLLLKEDAAFLEKLGKVKRENKARLAAYIQHTEAIKVNPDAIFDVQVKRMHAYKRQLLNVLKIMDIYNRIKEGTYKSEQPYVFIFSGKAAPGYYFAKQIIKLINTVADRVNNDPEIGDQLKVVFMENFNVSKAELIYPGADISEQISTASREASGTGNMKFMFNGAITLGTLDGANVEIRDLVGDDNIMIFGLKAEEVLAYFQQWGYHSWDEYHANPRLQHVVDQLVNGDFGDECGMFQNVYDSLLRDNDHFFVLKDFQPYLDSFEKLDLLYQDKQSWNKSCLVNIAKAGYFSSDRTIHEYAEKIWRIKGKR